MHAWKLLFEELDGANALARIVLMRFVLNYADLNGSVCSIKELAVKLRVHDKGIRSALKFLVDHQYLRIANDKRVRRGRSSRVITVGERTQVLMKSHQKLMFHQNLVIELLKGVVETDEVESPSKSADLKNSTTLLLAVLYGQADPDMKVQDLGFKSLASWTGLNSGQLRRRICLLKDCGIILEYKPGKLYTSNGVNSIGSYKLTANLGSKSGSPFAAFIFDAEIIGDFTRSVLLAQALVALGYNHSDTLNESQKLHFLGIYRVREDFIRHAIACLGFLHGFGNIGGKRFWLLCSFLCQQAAALIEERKKGGVPDNLSQWVGERLGRYGQKLVKSLHRSVSEYLAEVIFLLYEEMIDELIKRYGEEFEVRLLQHSMTFLGIKAIKFVGQFESASEDVSEIDEVANSK